MCLKTTPDSERKIAKEGIVVFKNGRRDSGGRLRPPYTEFSYYLGLLNIPLPLYIDSDQQVQEGYHSWSRFTDLWEVKDGGNLFVIPKGSTYIEGITDYGATPCVVSSQIVWLGSVWSPLS